MLSEVVSCKKDCKSKQVYRYSFLHLFSDSENGDNIMKKIHNRIFVKKKEITQMEATLDKESMLWENSG